MAALLAAGTAAADEGEGGTASGDEPASAGAEISVDALAHGQYTLVTGDGHKLLEDEGGAMSSGFLLDGFHLGVKLANGMLLRMGLGVLVPDRPAWSEGYFFLSVRRPARWAIRADVSRAVSFTDDSIGSVSSTEGSYPSHSLGSLVGKSRLLAGLSASVAPGPSSIVRLRLDYSWIAGEEVPLKGSEFLVPGAGPIFEYPALWDVGDHRGAFLVDALWSKGGLGLTLTSGYRVSYVDETLAAYRPLDGTAFDGTDTYARRRLVQSVFGQLGATLAVTEGYMLQGAYYIGYVHSKPYAATDRFGNVWRIEYGEDGGYGVLTHRVPLGILLSPAAGLDLRLHLVGSYTSGRTERTSQAYMGEPGTQIGEASLRAGILSKEFMERFELAYGGPDWLDLKLRQRFEIENRDLYRAMLDTFDADGVDETRVEDTALVNVRTDVETILKFRIVKGLVLEARGRFDYTWQDEILEQIVDWMPYGNSRAWKVSGKLRLSYRLSGKVALWADGMVFKGVRLRPAVTEIDEDAAYDSLGFVAGAGVRITPVGWLSLYAAYSYTHGDYEVGSAALLGSYGPILYTGRIHAVRGGFGLSPLAWLGVDAGYEMVLVTGSLENVLHRVNAEARFKVWKDIHLGVGYMGRIFDDDLLPDDAYGGHAMRALISGKF